MFQGGKNPSFQHVSWGKSPIFQQISWENHRFPAVFPAFFSGLRGYPLLAPPGLRLDLDRLVATSALAPWRDGYEFRQRWYDELTFLVEVLGYGSELW